MEEVSERYAEDFVERLREPSRVNRYAAGG
jgi:hypothetical protein